MREKDDDRIINNNIRLVSNSTGDRVLQTYGLPNLSEKFKKRLNFVKQTRLLQKMEEYKRRNNNIPELLDQKKVSCCMEQYILNRTNIKPTVVEQEIIIGQDGQQYSEADKAALMEDKTRNSVAKYRLQRNPYEEVNKKGDGDNVDTGLKGPEEQIYKDDLQYEYRTIIDKNNDGISDIIYWIL